MGHQQWITGEPKIVVAHPCGHQGDRDCQWRRDPAESRAKRSARSCLPEEPPKKPKRDWRAEQKSLVWAAVRQNRDAKREPQRIGQASASRDAGHRSEYKRTANCRNGTAPVAVHPVARDA